MATNTEDFEWIFDYIVTFLKSPPWTVPLNTFIDENCVIFDSDEENKLSYTDVHTNFVKLVEDLLESNLAEIGVSQEQFVRACEKGQNQEVNKLIFGQILAVEDFLTFKKMMIKRNMELEVEALRALQQPQIAAVTKPNTTPSQQPQRHSASPTNQIEADAQLELAIRLSQESSLLGQKTNSETTDGQSSRVPDRELEAALRASVVDQEVFQSEYQKEQAELEHALAISLALEAEKIRHEQAQADAELKAVMDQVSRLEASEREEKRKALEAAAKEREAKEAAAREAAQKAARELAAKQAAEREAREKKQRDEEAKRAQQQQQSQPQAPPKPKPAELPSITISGSTAAHEELRLAASRIEDAFSRNHEATRQQKQQAREALQTQGSVSNGELERRKEFLLQQKQLILARKKKERDEQLRQFNEEKKQIAPTTTTSTQQSAPSTQLTAEQLREQQRSQMREALAKRLKVDMIESERKRMAQQAENKYAVLNEQLRQVEALREKKTKQSAEEEAALVQQEKERQAKLRAFHENLRKQGVQVDDFSF